MLAPDECVCRWDREMDARLLYYAFCYGRGHRKYVDQVMKYPHIDVIGMKQDQQFGKLQKFQWFVDMWN